MDRKVEVVKKNIRRISREVEEKNDDVDAKIGTKPVLLSRKYFSPVSSLYGYDTPQDELATRCVIEWICEIYVCRKGRMQETTERIHIFTSELLKAVMTSCST
jgi:hypothetical protein